MCSFCERTQTVYDPMQESMIGLAKYARGEGYLLIVTQGQKNPQAVNLLIRFCPYCGGDIAQVRAAYAEKLLDATKAAPIDPTTTGTANSK